MAVARSPVIAAPFRVIPGRVVRGLGGERQTLSAMATWPATKGLWVLARGRCGATGPGRSGLGRGNPTAGVIAPVLRGAGRWQKKSCRGLALNLPAATRRSFFVVDAVILMLLAGMFQVLVGLVAIFENEIYVQTRNYLFKFDVTTWGWIHLVVGIVVGLAGLGMLRGRTWARVAGIILAVLSAIANFLFIPYYPVWALLIIAVDVFVIWALAVHGREVITG
jgi:hypothetical protein